jgi:hypothetical protein
MGRHVLELHMVDLNEYEYEVSPGVTITALLSEDDAARYGAKQITAPRNKAVDTGQIRTRASRADGTAGYGN